MRSLLLLLLTVLLSHTWAEARRGSLSSVRHHRNSSLANTDRLRSLVRKKVKRIIKARKQLKPSYDNGMIDRLNR